MEFTNRTFLVTGGASGLGRATATELLKRGAHVVVADLTGDAPDGGVFIETDVTDEAAVQAAVTAANRQPGPLSGVVNCAGTSGERGVIVNTPILDVLSEQAQQSLGEQMPFPARLSQPSEFAALACHIVQNQMLNGEVIRLDGAIRMAPR